MEGIQGGEVREKKAKKGNRLGNGKVLLIFKNLPLNECGWREKTGRGTKILKVPCPSFLPGL